MTLTTDGGWRKGRWAIWLTRTPHRAARPTVCLFMSRAGAPDPSCDFDNGYIRFLPYTSKSSSGIHSVRKKEIGSGGSS